MVNAFFRRASGSRKHVSARTRTLAAFDLRARPALNVPGGRHNDLIGASAHLRATLCRRTISSQRIRRAQADERTVMKRIRAASRTGVAILRDLFLRHTPAPGFVAVRKRRVGDLRPSRRWPCRNFGLVPVVDGNCDVAGSPFMFLPLLARAEPAICFFTSREAFRPVHSPHYGSAMTAWGLALDGTDRAFECELGWPVVLDLRGGRRSISAFPNCNISGLGISWPLGSGGMQKKKKKGLFPR